MGDGMSKSRPDGPPPVLNRIKECLPMIGCEVYRMRMDNVFTFDSKADSYVNHHALDVFQLYLNSF